MKPIKTHKKVTTIILEEDELNGEGIEQMWYCPNCRSPVLQYKGSVMHIVPGMHPYEPSTKIKCKGTKMDHKGIRVECNTYYAFLPTSQTERYLY